MIVIEISAVNLGALCALSGLAGLLVGMWLLVLFEKLGGDDG